MSDQSVVMVPRWLWESLGEILRECEVSCTVPVRVGSSDIEWSATVTGTGVRADGHAVVWVGVDFGDGSGEHEMAAGETSDWVLS